HLHGHSLDAHSCPTRRSSDLAENNTFGGMAIDLWEIVAGKLDLATHYVAYPTFRELVEATRAGDVDAAVTNLTITRNRAELISRSEEHTSELQSREKLVCRLL